MMTERTLRVLEFPRVREMLAEGALTAMGAEKCRALVPYDTLFDIDQAQKETEEATVILQYVGGHPMTEFPDARPVAENRQRPRSQHRGGQEQRQEIDSPARFLSRLSAHFFLFSPFVCVFSAAYRPSSALHPAASAAGRAAARPARTPVPSRR